MNGNVGFGVDGRPTYFICRWKNMDLNGIYSVIDVRCGGNCRLMFTHLCQHECGGYRGEMNVDHKHLHLLPLVRIETHKFINAMLCAKYTLIRNTHTLTQTKEKQ